jgi:hypothetical protein
VANVKIGLIVVLMLGLIILFFDEFSLAGLRINRCWSCAVNNNNKKSQESLKLITG